MDSIKDIRDRMTSVQKTKKITNAMYLMASSRLKRARNKLQHTAPYFDKLQYVVTDILNHTDEGRQRYLATDREIPPDEVKHAYIIITSDKGLCGAYNLNVCRLAEQELKKTKHNNLYFIGYNGFHYFSRHPELGNIEQDHVYSASDPELYRARRLAEYLVNRFLTYKVDEVHIVYTKMLNAMVSEPQVIQILPLTTAMFPVVPAEDSRSYHTDYAPSPMEVLNTIVPNVVKGLIFGATVEAFASEQNARMTAMQSATDNADQIVQDLSLQYNRVRQAAITTELTEVVAGANAQQQK